LINIKLCIYSNFSFICSFVDRHLDYFHVLAIVNNVLVNKECIYLFEILISSFKICTQNCDCWADLWKSCQHMLSEMFNHHSFLNSLKSGFPPYSQLSLLLPRKPNTISYHVISLINELRTCFTFVFIIKSFQKAFSDTSRYIFSLHFYKLPYILHLKFILLIIYSNYVLFDLTNIAPFTPLYSERRNYAYFAYPFIYLSTILIPLHNSLILDHILIRILY
jgi:hypothetical protein